MKSTIEKIYFNIDKPSEQWLNHIPKYKEQEKIVKKSQKKLRACMNDNEYTHIIKMSDAYWNMITMVEKEKFKQGLGYGLMLAFEAFYYGKPQELKEIFSKLGL